MQITQPVLNCIGACTRCLQLCKACADDCEEMGGMDACVRLCLQCADCCSDHAKSIHVGELHHQDRCIRICEECATECEKYSRRLEVCRRTAESCWKCAEMTRRANSAQVFEVPITAGMNPQ